MTHILLTRHGETDWNVIGRVQGWTDTALNGLGRAQAAALAARLKDMPLSAVYSSDSCRAAETARPIAEQHGLALQTLPDLREKGFGDWEGLTVTDLERDYADLWHRYHVLHELDSAIPNGETYSDVYDRVRRALCAILDAHPGADDTVLVAGAWRLRSRACAGGSASAAVRASAVCAGQYVPEPSGLSRRRRRARDYPQRHQPLDGHSGGKVA